MGVSMEKRWYCVKCGKSVDREELLGNGYCVDCFLREYGVFAKTPVLELTVCTKCGSWRIRGRWFKVGLEEAIRHTLLDNQSRYTHDYVEILEVDEVYGIHSIGKGLYRVFTKMHVLIGPSVREVDGVVEYRLSKTVCPECMRKASKTYNAVVQVRSMRGKLSSFEKSVVEKILSEPSIASDVVEVVETRNGVDIRLLSPVTARRIASILNRDYGARVIETFKTRKYDPSRGKRLGVTTFSVRLPDLSIGDVVSYNGVYGVICNVYGGSFRVYEFSSDKYRVFSIEDYWSKRVVRVEDVVSREYTVVGYDSSTIYLIDEEGSMIEYPRLVNLNSVREGDKIRGYWIKDRLYMVKIG